MRDDTAFETAILKIIGGYDALIHELVMTMTSWQYSQQRPWIVNKILLHGKPGSGKTALAMAIAKTSGLPYLFLNAPDVFMAEEGESEIKLQKIFFDAQVKDTCVVIIDEVDMLACKMDKQKSGLDTRISSVFQTCIDRLPSHVFLLALTNRPHAMDPSLLRSGRLDTSYELVMKTSEQRFDVLTRLLQHLPFDTPEQQQDFVQKLSQRTHGFVPSDLQSLCAQIVLLLVKQEHITSQKPMVTWALMEDTLAAARPSGLSAFASPAPNVQFCDIYGMDTVIRDIKASVITPFQRPEQYIALGITAPKGILLHGPPGTGKTMICCALAREAGVNYIFVESTQLRSKVVGESEKSIANLFSHARSNSPCILFIDQIDILVPKRGSRSTSENTGDRIVTGFLTEMDGLLTKSKSASTMAQMDVLVVATTNRIEVIDEAVLRPGRFDEHIQIQLPDQHQRKAIIQGLTKKIPLEMSPEQLDEMVTQSRGWAGADLENILREAAMENLRQDRQATKVTYQHVQRQFGK